MAIAFGSWSRYRVSKPSNLVIIHCGPRRVKHTTLKTKALVYINRNLADHVCQTKYTIAWEDSEIIRSAVTIVMVRDIASKL
jgi:hypothetical protein